MRAALAVGILVLFTATAHAQLELRNDGFVDQAQAGFQGGFVAGEIGASRFVAPSAGRRLQRIRFLFGGAATQQTMTLRVWDDSAGGNAPGGELYTGDFQVTGSNSAMQDLDLTGENITVPQQFRIGIEFQHGGLPSIARDDDGTIAADRNYIYANVGAGGMWFRSQSLGLTGDWIVRAVVSDSGGGPDAGVPDAMTGPDGGGGGPDGGGGGGECDGNGDCALGEYCDTNLHTCTFDCRTSDDCGGDDCNSLGQCVAGTGPDGAGCCSTGDAGVPGAALLGVMVALVLSRRRRRA